VPAGLPAAGRSGPPGATRSAALAPDGQTLAVGALALADAANQPRDNPFYLLNLHDGRILLLPGVHVDCHAVAFSPDGDRLATQAGRLFLFKGLKDVWKRAAAPVPWITLETRTVGPRLAFSPDGSRLALSTVSDTTLRLWDRTARPGSPVTSRPASTKSR
jgi:WD40 repeat protein